MGRALATLGAVLVLALVAGGLTEVTLAYGHGIGQDLGTVPRPTSKPVVTPPATPRPTPATTPIPTPSPTPIATVAATATTNSFVHMRAGMSTSTAIILNLNAGTVVTLEPGGDTLWQEIDYRGYRGYVYKSYLSY